MMRRRILAIATALILGIASTSGAALAHGGGGGGGGHGGGGFGGGHAAGFGGGHFGGGFGGRMGEAHGFAMRGGFDGPSFAHHDFGHGHFAHDFRDRRFARGFGFGGLYGYCGWPYAYDYNSCYTSSW
jgi:hypothetical protein